MKPEDVLGFTWRAATMPWRLGIGTAHKAARSGEHATRSLAASGERTAARLLETVLDAVLSDQVLDRVLARIEQSGVAQHVAQHLLESGVVEQIADRLLSGPEFPRMLRAAFRSELPDELVAQLLTSEAVWMLVNEVVQSPSVTDAITHQGMGFVEQVGSKARDRSREADARLQRLAQRLGRRRHPTAEGAT